MLSVLLALCEGNHESPDSPHQGLVKWSFDVFCCYPKQVVVQIVKLLVTWDILNITVIFAAVLTYWNLNKMDKNFQTTFSIEFLWMKIVVFWFKFHQRLILRISSKAAMVWVTALCLTGTKPLSELILTKFHQYLDECWISVQVMIQYWEDGMHWKVTVGFLASYRADVWWKCY